MLRPVDRLGLAGFDGDHGSGGGQLQRQGGDRPGSAWADCRSHRNGRARGAAKPAGPPIQFSGPLPDLTWKCRITPVSFLGIEIDSTRNQASAPITAQLFHEGMNTSAHCRASGSISRRISDSQSPIALSPAASNNRGSACSPARPWRRSSRGCPQDSDRSSIWSPLAPANDCRNCPRVMEVERASPYASVRNSSNPVLTYCQPFCI